MWSSPGSRRKASSGAKCTGPVSVWLRSLLNTKMNHICAFVCVYIYICIYYVIIPLTVYVFIYTYIIYIYVFMYTHSLLTAAGHIGFLPRTAVVLWPVHQSKVQTWGRPLGNPFPCVIWKDVSVSETMVNSEAFIDR